MPDIPYPHNSQRPPKAPTVRHGVANLRGVVMDTAKYLLDPDDDFARPYLAIPGGRAFVWPLGVESFEVADQAELGRHKYLGAIEVDVDVTHRAETTITMSGVFPGWTSVDNMNALRDIFYRETPERGKILHLPGILPNLQYVVGESLRHTKAEDDWQSMDIAYNITFVKVGTGRRGPNVGPTRPNQGQDKGRKAGRFRVNSKYNTLRKIAMKVYRNSDRWTELYAIKKNAQWFDRRNIPSHQAPSYRLPNGLVIYY